MGTQTIILVGVGIYLIAMILMGFYASRSARSADDFIVSGRRMPIWLCTATLAATWFGAGPMVGSAGAAYKDGFLGVIADPFGGALVLFLIGLFFVRIFRRLRLLTFVELFTIRFGKTAATLAAVSAILANIGWTGAMLVAFGVVFQSVTGISLEVGIISGAIVVLIYTSVGGMWAVALTDLVQMVIIAIGLILLMTVVLMDVGGWNKIAAQLPEHTFRLVPLEHTPVQWLNYLRAWLIFGLADVGEQAILQRGMSAKNEQVAQNSFYLSSLVYLSFGMIPVLLGIIASVTIPGLSEPENVIPLLAIKHLHPVAIAVFMGALLAAIMSTTDSALLACASIWSTNLLPLFKPRASDRARLLATKIAIPVFGVFAVTVALYSQVVYELIVDANSIKLACVTAPFIAGVWWSKANRIGVLAGMGAGFAAWATAVLHAPDIPGDLLGLFVCLVVMVMVSLLTQRFDAPRPVRNDLGEEVELKDRLGVLPLFRQVE